MAGFCELAIGLRAPELGSPGAKSPIVSGGYLKYSRFRETGTGDWVRYALRRRVCSAKRYVLRLGRRHIGNVEPGLPRDRSRILNLSCTASAPNACDELRRFNSVKSGI
jgi:hypothetical protein